MEGRRVRMAGSAQQPTLHRRMERTTTNPSSQDGAREILCSITLPGDRAVLKTAARVFKGRRSVVELPCQGTETRRRVIGAE